MPAESVVFLFVFLAAATFAQQAERLGPGISPPRAAAKIIPSYSDTARERRIEGKVIIHAIVRKDGAVEMIGVKEGLGYGLDENAVLALRRLKLSPAVKNGVPIDIEMDIAVDFNLNDPNQVEPRNERPPGKFCRQRTYPTVVSRIEPQLTDAARAAGITGTVVLDSTVKADGHVDVIRVRRSLGFGLDAAAIAAIDKWTFRPATCDGKSQDTTLNIEVNFKGSR